jgi:UDP-N-acetylglucosamine 2-epimerase (non-hydrolysing)
MPIRQRPFHAMTVFGTRPEAIKMAPVVRALRDESDQFRQTVCVTAQHREMLDQVVQLFEIEPDIDLDLMEEAQGLADLTSRILQGMSETLEEHRPDIVLVHGDTTTTFATSLAAFYKQIPVAHVEAGLRTGDLAHPWPEEANRQLTDTLTELFFAPTEKARENLLRENVPDARITVTGNTVIDALLWVREKLRESSQDRSDIAELLAQNSDQEAAPDALVDFIAEGLTTEDAQRAPMVLITGHRRENFGRGFQNIVAAIESLAERYPAARFVYPVHLNPRVQEPVYSALSGLPNVDLLPPLDYAPFVFMMDRASLLLTDSGGIQEEAPSLGKPVLVMRETTERPEAIEAGTARLVGTDATTIEKTVARLLDDPTEYDKMARAANPFGDGNAAQRTVDALAEWNRARQD